MIQSFFNSLLKVTMTTSIIIALLLLLLPLINRIFSANWRYYVWMLLALRLTIPFNFTLLHAPIEISPPAQNVAIHVPTSDHGSTIQPNNADQKRIVKNLVVPVKQSLSLNLTLSVIWLIGLILFLLYHFIGYLLFRKMLSRYTSAIDDQYILNLWNDEKKLRNVKINIPILLCKKIQSPMMTGFLKPVLLLPYLDYSETELNVILKHELIHFRRKDIYYKLLLIIANALHWFNPLIYLMVSQSNKDIEMVCDLEVVKNSDLLFRKQYSETILSAIHRGSPQQTAFSTYFYGGKKTIKQRLENILDISCKRKGIISFIMIVAILASSGAVVAYRFDNYIDNMVLLKAGNTHSLDSSGNVILSYNHGEKQIKAPLVLNPNGKSDESGMNEDQTGFYISNEKTAIVYGGFNGNPVSVLVSDDTGKTWNTYTVTKEMRGSTKFINFLTKENGWLVLSSFRGMGSEDHYIYKTSDGGRTWTEVTGNANNVYARVLTGIGFSDKKIGFLSFRYDFTEFDPAICWTRDGGRTWAKLTVTLPKEYAEYNKTPLSPVFTGANGLFPIELSKDGADNTIGTVYLKSSDWGKTWTFDQKYNMALVWANAWKTRNGEPRYAVMSQSMKADFRKQREEINGDPNNFVIRWSSPWVDNYDVKLDGNDAVITYWYADSTPATYKGVERITFGEENGRLVVTGSKTEVAMEPYENTAVKTIDTGLYTLTVPKNWVIHATSDYYQTYSLGNSQIGSLELLGYDRTVPISQFEGNHAQPLRTEELIGLSYPAWLTVIRRSKPAAAMDNSFIDELHIYLLPKNTNFAVDLSFDSAKVKESKAVEVAKSVMIKDSPIIASIDKNQTQLSAQSLVNGMYSNILVSILGKQKNFPIWKNINQPSFLPTLSYLDVNGDGTEELIIILCTGEGTGVLNEEIHILNPEDLSEIAVEDPSQVLKNRIVSKISDKGIKISIDNKVASFIPEDKIVLQVSEKKSWFSKLTTGSLVDYEIQNGQVVLNVGAKLSPSGFLGNFAFSYAYQNNRLQIKNITFVSYVK